MHFEQTLLLACWIYDCPHAMMALHCDLIYVRVARMIYLIILRSVFRVGTTTMAYLTSGWTFYNNYLTRGRIYLSVLASALVFHVSYVRKFGCSGNVDGRYVFLYDLCTGTIANSMVTGMYRLFFVEVAMTSRVFLLRCVHVVIIIIIVVLGEM